MVYKMSYNQLRYFPRDNWADIAEQIRQPDYPISKAANDISRNYGITQTEAEIQEVLSRNNILYTPSEIPQAMPKPEQVEWEVRKWQEYVYPHLLRNVILFPPVYKL